MLKKFISSLIIGIMAFNFVACGNSQTTKADSKSTQKQEQKKEEPKKTDVTNNKESKNVETKPKEEVKQLPKEETKATTPDKNQVTTELKQLVGKGEQIEDVKISGRDIIIDVNLGNDSDAKISPKDLALTRYSGISDYLLKDTYWSNITVNFKNVGTIKMNSNQATKNEYGMKYIPGLDIEKNFVPCK